MSKAKKIAIVSDASGNISGANISYTGTLTGGTGVVAIGTNQIYKDASGNVGIGTTSPTALRTRNLEVSSSGTNDGAAVIVGKLGTGIATVRLTGLDTTVGTDINFNYPNTGDLSFFDRASSLTRMIIDSSGNVGIGTSSPSNKLDVVGDNTYLSQRASSTGQAGGGVWAMTSTYWSTPTYTGTGIQQFGSTATGTTAGLANANLGVLVFQNNSAGLITTNGGAPLVFSTTSTERMRIDSSGNVGIGCTPSSLLSIQKYNPAGLGPELILNNSGNSVSDSMAVTFASGAIGSGARGQIKVTVDNNPYYGIMTFSRGSSNATLVESMRLNSVGNLGIGTTNPTQRLHVMGSTIFDFTHGQNIKLGVSAGNNGNTTYSGDAYLYLWTSEPGMTWTGAGIGRNIVNTSNFPRVNTNLSGQMIRFDEGDSASISLITETKAGTRYTPLYVTDGNVFMNSGNLMIGTTSSVNTNTKIYAVTAGQDDNNGIIQAYNTNSAAGNSASLMTRSYWGTGQFMSWSSSGMRIGMRSVVNGGSAAVYYTYANDNIGFGNNSALGTGVLYTNGGLLTNTNPSDARLKTDIQDITLGLDFISQLKPVSYKWLNNRANQDTQYGFIAQDVQEIEPSLVREFEAAVDIDSENSDDRKTVTRLGLEEKGIYTAMVKAIQELKIIIDTQNARIEALEAK